MEVTTVGSWLQSRHICVRAEWVEAAVGWLKEENEGQRIPIEKLKEMVYEQWLLGDLTGMAAPCLPEGISTAEKMVLNGAFCVQINSIKDASASHYSQLQKLKGTENENARVSAAEPSQPSWEAKSSRMLKMVLSDGVQEVEAMEHKPIPALGTTTPPGTKICLKGPILTRVGVLFLSSKNVNVLGGEVDALGLENSQVRLMEKALNLEPSNDMPQEVNHGGVAHEMEFDDDIPDELFDDIM